MSEQFVIRCSGVVKHFGHVVALDHLDLEVPRGLVVGFLGPNGAGKSTTIRILLDLSRPDAGDVRLFGEDPAHAGPGLRRRIGYLPGELRLDERLSVEQTLRSWAKIRGKPVTDAHLTALCDRLELDRKRHTRGLSTGNRRKLGLAGAFMSEPELLILDEPTAGLNPLVQAEFRLMVEEARERGATVFLSSHVLSEVQRVADRVVVIRAGRAVVSGSMKDLLSGRRQPFSAWFPSKPPLAELGALPGVSGLEVRGGEVEGTWQGPPGPLLALFARHEVEHILMPEPDLESAFLRYYEEAPGAPTAAAP